MIKICQLEANVAQIREILFGRRVADAQLRLMFRRHWIVIKKIKKENRNIIRHWILHCVPDMSRCYVQLSYPDK